MFWKAVYVYCDLLGEILTCGFSVQKKVDVTFMHSDLEDDSQ